MRYYVVSDIHGFYTEFRRALKDAGFNDDKSPCKVIVCGDLFDRGREATQLQSYILQLMHEDRIILIRGNHEDLFQELVEADRGMAYQHHISNGTYDTALQLTGYDPVMAKIKNFDFAEEAKRTPYYQKIMPAMKDYYETANYVFVHGWVPGFFNKFGYNYFSDWRESSAQEWNAARWLNGMACIPSTLEDKTIVCGHWHASYGHSRIEERGSEFGPDADFTPYIAPGIIAMDACTAQSGFVNCVVIDE